MAWANVDKYSDAEIRGIGMTSQRTRDRLAVRLAEQGISNRKVLRVMAEVPRHLFMDEALASRAYDDVALPIGEGQTISQPYIVARMTEQLVEQSEIQKVLEIGTGSGYQAAVLSRVVTNVYTCERIQSLLRTARERFRRLGYSNIETCHSDGSWGWQEKAPFDAIIITAAAEQVPQELLLQLRSGGILLCPVGPRGGVQELMKYTCDDRGIHSQSMGSVKFVPLLGGKF